jgi:hypothetical protein
MECDYKTVFAVRALIHIKNFLCSESVTAKTLAITPRANIVDTDPFL